MIVQLDLNVQRPNHDAATFSVCYALSAKPERISIDIDVLDRSSAQITPTNSKSSVHSLSGTLIRTVSRSEVSYQQSTFSHIPDASLQTNALGMLKTRGSESEQGMEPVGSVKRKRTEHTAGGNTENSPKRSQSSAISEQTSVPSIESQVTAPSAEDQPTFKPV